MKLDKLIGKSVSKEFYRDGDSFVKVFDKKYSVSDILNEALNHARVSDAGVSVPRLRAVTQIEDGRWAIVMDFIEGKTLQELMDENPDKKDEYLTKFIDIQMSLFKFRVSLLSRLKDKMQRKISETNLEATVRYELHMRLEGMPRHYKLCHGDFSPSNVMVGSDGKDYIIDWAHATQGNASADVSRTYLMFCLKADQQIADEYMAKYCKASDTARQYVIRWLPIVAASQSVKGNPQEQAFLRKWTDIVDYE